MQDRLKPFLSGAYREQRWWRWWQWWCEPLRRIQLPVMKRRSSRLAGATAASTGSKTKKIPAAKCNKPSAPRGPDALGAGCSANERVMRARELALHKRGVGPIAGVDEAGRGPLMGPVVAAAVVIPLHVHIEGIADSKALTHQRREELFELIKNHPDVHHAVSIVDHHTIDRYARGASCAVCACAVCVRCA